MIELGKIQWLNVVRKTLIGLYLSPENSNGEEAILLPQNQVPPEIEIGDKIEVFVYRDSEDRIISTLKKPKLLLGELALLKVIEITKFGAFLDWGLEKDLFLPYKEQIGEISEGNTCLVCLYLDKSDRLCATMKIYNKLSTISPYKEDDKVMGTVLNINKEIGVFVAVENKYQGLIPNKEVYRDFYEGDKIEVRIKKVLPDGKLELSTRDKAYMEIEDDSQRIMEKLKSMGGSLKLNDSSSP
jgi:predicted RNA-binding protein (virulence factor B family)